MRESAIDLQIFTPHPLSYSLYIPHPSPSSLPIRHSPTYSLFPSFISLLSHYSFSPISPPSPSYKYTHRRRVHVHMSQAGITCSDTLLDRVRDSVTALTHFLKTHHPHAHHWQQRHRQQYSCPWNVLLTQRTSRANSRPSYDPSTHSHAITRTRSRPTHRPGHPHARKTRQTTTTTTTSPTTPNSFRIDKVSRPIRVQRGDRENDPHPLSPSSPPARIFTFAPTQTSGDAIAGLIQRASSPPASMVVIRTHGRLPGGRETRGG